MDEDFNDLMIRLTDFVDANLLSSLVMLNIIYLNSLRTLLVTQFDIEKKRYFLFNIIFCYNVPSSSSYISSFPQMLSLNRGKLGIFTTIFSSPSQNFRRNLGIDGHYHYLVIKGE